MKAKTRVGCYLAGSFVLLSLWVLGLYVDHVPSTARVTQLSNAKKGLTPVPIVKKVAHVATPKAHFAAVDSQKYTSMVGTVATPTIDGGIINTTDNLPLQKNATPPSVDTVQSGDLASVKSNKPITNNTQIIPTPAFDDKWINDKKIETILLQATQSGKLPVVLQQAKEKNLPAGVALLPIIESAYRTTALSPKGAAGDWQLMPETAKELGLTTEQRTDFVLSTRSALTLLEKHYKAFNNWELTFAAYNAGAGRVSRALAQNPAATTLDELNIPQETKTYVHRLKNIVAILDAKKSTL